MVEEKEELGSQLCSMKEHHVSLQHETRQMEQELEATKTELRTRWVGRGGKVCHVQERGRALLSYMAKLCTHSMHCGIYILLFCMCPHTGTICVYTYVCTHLQYFHSHMPTTHPFCLTFLAAKELHSQHTHSQQHAPRPCPAHSRARAAQVHHGGDTGHQCELGGCLGCVCVACGG